MKYDALLFDFDGVLADTEPLHCAAWAQALQPLGVTFDWNTYVSASIGVTDREFVAFLARRADMDFERLWQRYPDKQRFFRERVLAESPVPHETVDLLRELSVAGHALAVVTSTSRTEIEPLLHRAGIKNCFRAGVYREDVMHHKPDPEPYRLAAERLGARRPLVIEDSEPGLASGRAAGFDVLRIADPRRTGELVRERLGMHNFR